MKKLDELAIGKSAKITKVKGKGATRQHLLDMGLIPDAVIRLVKYAPMGDPIEFQINGYELTLRKDDARNIEIEDYEAKEEDVTREKVKSSHPGLGEGGRYHDKKTEKPLSEDTVLTFALVGQQNAGKTTLFNQLTGSNQHVGNFPGVTVDRKDGVIRGYPNTLVIDLPGIYSMSPYSNEELISRDFVLNEKPKGIINIIDATSIERGLYLTMQLLEMDIPMVLALNMMDEIENNHGYIDINGLESYLGIPVVPISAAKNEGIDELVKHAIHVAKYQEKPLKQDYCNDTERGGAIHRCLHAIMHMIDDHCKDNGLPLRFCATKCAEGDQLIIDRLYLDQNEKETLEHLVGQMESESGLDKAAAIADMRYSFIRKATAETVIKPVQSKENIRSGKLDAILTGKYTALPVFIAIMGLVFYLTFEVIGGFLQGLLETGIDNLGKATEAFLISSNVSEFLRSLIVNGIFGGVGSVLSFIPIIVVLFFFLSILEDSGYMARVAFFMDKLLRKIGLSGRSIVPMLIGFGCTVPAVMSSRTLPSERDRKMTILLTPYMSCSAKLPIYAFFCDAFFPAYKAVAMICLYLLGIAVSIVVALVFKNSIFKGEAVPFVMELPNYRLPRPRNVAQLLWEKAKDFLQRAFTVIFVATLVVWFLQNFSFSLQMVSDPERSILASLAGLLAPVFKPCGLGSWQTVTALITGFLAKESVVSTLSLLYGSVEMIQATLSTIGAISLLVFCLLYSPCVAAIAAVKQEMGRPWAIGVVILQCSVAWICSFLVYNIGSLLF
ncbi:MAG: ferrous iron transport protein B [Erysipelotrichaceae bacterium]|nr:ferrous iron transport protein B [Erysipelotrichaceae bacterium]